MTEIQNWSGYLTEMRKSMFDKLFFVDKFYEPIKTIIDYGCADGSLIQMCRELFPQYNYVGYDNSGDMIARAKKQDATGFYTTDWSEIKFNPD